MDKKELRRQIKELKAQQNKALWMDKSDDIFEFIERLESFDSAKKVMVYWSLGDEVSTRGFIERWAEKKEVYLPVVKGDRLAICRFEGIDRMRPEPVFGILEPQSDQTFEVSEIDLMVIPGMAFDRQCNRLGRGKGYYDRLLEAYKGIKIGVCFDFQLVESVPVDPFDIPMDLVVTEADVAYR